MDLDIPYMPSVGNLHKILNKIQQAGAPEAFGLDFLRDLGFASSNDRAVIKVMKYLGLLDANGKPQNSYREFMDGSKAKSVLADRLKAAYDDLFLSDKAANSQSTEKLKGWFKTKTGKGDAVAEKMATTFKSLASYASWDGKTEIAPLNQESASADDTDKKPPAGGEQDHRKKSAALTNIVDLAFSYRIEVHLPDTTNVETYRAIFKALREELASE